MASTKKSKGAKKSAEIIQEKMSFASFIGPHFEGQRLIDFLCKRFTYFDATKWSSVIHSGDLLLNKKQPTGEEALKNGDKVEYMAMTRPEPKVPTHIPVLYEDEDLLIVNKPAHLPVHPSGRYLRNTLINILKAQRKNPMLFLAHRLDRETSGVCVLTKSHLAKEKMYWQFFNYETEKTYWALCWGIPNPPSGIIDVPIGGSDPKRSRIRIKQLANGIDSKTAKTRYHTLSTRWIEAPQWKPPPWPALFHALKKHRRFDGAAAASQEEILAQHKSPWPVSLVECTPKTGRTNQIRVHMAHVGAGLVGDKLYDPDESVFMNFKEGSPQMASLKKDPRSHRNNESYLNLSQELERRLVLEAHALHAKSLKIRHPRTNRPLLIEAPAPTSWRSLYEVPRS